jgi:hypothetical protein
MKIARITTVLVGVLTLSVAISVAAPVAAAGGGKPSIRHLSVSHLTRHGATLRAQIDPEGSETGYEVWVLYSPCKDCELLEEVLAGTGEIAASHRYEAVSARFTRQIPLGAKESFLVLATNTSGSMQSKPYTFERK